ncbi:hypothetical protein Tco_0083789 [Tanacetum coccineum]
MTNDVPPPPMDLPNTRDKSSLWWICNSHVKDNKIDLVQQYEQFIILEEESIDSGFARFNTIITSLKALDEGFSSKNYVRKFLRALHPKWRAKVMAIEESKDLSSLALDELIENEVLELNEKIKKLERSKEIDIACRLCQELKSENARLKETQAKFVKFDKSANLLREMLDNQKSSSCKVGLGFDSNKASTSRTKPITFVGSSVKKAMDGSTIKVHGSTLLGSVSRTNGEKLTEHVFSPPMSSRSDFVITTKKLIHNKIDASKKPSSKPSLKSGIGYVKTESRLKTPPPRINISSQPRHNTPQPRRNSREPIHQNFYPMNWNNHQSQGFVHMGNCILFQYLNQLQQMQGMYNTNIFEPMRYCGQNA